MDINDLIVFLLTPAAQVALIVGVAEIIKRLGCPKKYIPLVDLALGVVSGVFVFGHILHGDIAVSVVVGVSLGLSACGLFSGIKNITEKR